MGKGKVMAFEIEHFCATIVVRGENLSEWRI